MKCRFFVAVISVLVLPGCCCHHEERIAALEKEVAELRLQLDAQSKPSPWSADAFNYLAIGNSITKHGINNHWWNEIGMAASDAEHDYYHLVLAGLRSRFGKVEGRTVNFSNWERTAHDRGQVLEDLAPLLDEKLDLVTIQLGENVRDHTTYAEDYATLVDYIKKKTKGNAKIIMIGAWGKEDPARRKVAQDSGISYADLQTSYGKQEYKSSIGAEVFDAAGNRHIVNHAGVAWHPGDRGMALIANQVLQELDRMPRSNSSTLKR